MVIMLLTPANQPQLIRSCQKDEYYQHGLRNHANEVFQTFAGSKRWLQWRKEIELVSDLAYYALTTMSGYQTLGEEYVNIVQVDPTQRKLPSRLRRGAFIFFHTFVPYALNKTLVCLENELEADDPDRSLYAPVPWSPMSYVKNWIQKAVRLLTESQRKSLIPLIFAVQQGITILHRVHVTLFYISGTFYHLSKRTAGISYLKVQNIADNDQALRTNYRLLGAVSLLQLTLSLILQLNNLRQRQRARQEWKQHRSLLQLVAESPSSPASRCILCLEERRHSTITPCGHLFCWECITDWCNTKADCPLCREKVQPHRLVYLRSYK
ncbi:peroxisome biogenesis factor 10 isoform X2 [Chanos chanos]|uniref:RING-type E3 ubiquitin transferase n=1 Tax=Chanos chanos TaxID=29144 RepID=A0A6J2W5H9_CHACN|nr:peroxisome biogenesis factor 10 isoform X2 [Chanos chanos]